jgi:hypothetical protein
MSGMPVVGLAPTLSAGQEPATARPLVTAMCGSSSGDGQDAQGAVRCGIHGSASLVCGALQFEIGEVCSVAGSVRSPDLGLKCRLPFKSITAGYRYRGDRFNGRVRVGELAASGFM